MSIFRPQAARSCPDPQQPRVAQLRQRAGLVQPHRGHLGLHRRRRLSRGSSEINLLIISHDCSSYCSFSFCESPIVLNWDCTTKICLNAIPSNY